MEGSVVRKGNHASWTRNPRDTNTLAFAGRTEVFVRHAFISENGDECHGSSHSSG